MESTDEPARLSRFRALGELILAPVFPASCAARRVAKGRYGMAFFAVTIAAMASAWVTGSRLEVSDRVMSRLEGKDSGDEESKRQLGDHEVREEVTKALRIEQVKLGLRASLGTPVGILFLGIVFYFVGRYVGGTPTMRKSVAAAAHATLPSVVKSLLTILAASRQEHLRPDELGALAWPGVLIAKDALRAGLEPFLLWSVIIGGFSLSEAAGISRRKAFAAIIVIFALKVAAKQISSR